MGIELLGPLQVDGVPAVMQRRDQVVLSALAVHAGEVLAADQLAEASWGETPPSSWPKQIQGSVLRLRRNLGSAAIETTAAGYRLTVPAEDVDCGQFEALIDRGQTLAVDGEFDRAAVVFRRALDLWRGVPFDVLDGWSPGRIEAARLDELRLSAEERLLDARLAAGEHRDVVPEAEARVAEAPLREHRWAILATALYRCGRQADALGALKHARRTLVEQLGIEPSAELVGLEQAILRQDESLLAVPAPPTISQQCPYKGLVPYDVGRRRVVLRPRRRGRDVCRTATDQSVAGRHRPVGVRQVVTGACRLGAGARPGRRAGGRVRARGGSRERDDQRHCIIGDGRIRSSSSISSRSCSPLDDTATRARSFCARLAAYATATAPVVVTVRADHVAALAADDGVRRSRRARPAPRQATQR